MHFYVLEFVRRQNFQVKTFIILKTTAESADRQKCIFDLELCKLMFLTIFKILCKFVFVMHIQRSVQVSNSFSKSEKKI